MHEKLKISHAKQIYLMYIINIVNMLLLIQS
jgi:hypothetical protein